MSSASAPRSTDSMVEMGSTMHAPLAMHGSTLGDALPDGVAVVAAAAAAADEEAAALV